MGRIRIANANISELRKKIRECKDNKRKVENYLFDLKDKWIFKEISSSEYEEALDEKRDGKTLEEWIKFYDDYAEKCEAKISEEENIINRNINLLPLLLISFILIIILVALIYFFKPASIIGLVIQDQQKVHIQEINLNLAESTSYEWILENPGKLESVKLSGFFENINGNENNYIKIYLDDLIILDSTQEVNKGKITGASIIETDKTKTGFFNSISNLFKNIFSGITGKTTGITGRASEENNNENQDAGNENKQDSDNSKENPSATQSDSQPQQQIEQAVQEKESDSAADSQNPESSSEEIPKQAEQEQNVKEEAPQTETNPSQEEPLPSENQGKTNTGANQDAGNENITETEKSQEKVKKPAEETNGKQPKEQLNEFTDVCEQTCDLSKFNLNKTSYTLRIEVLNTNLNIKEIKYAISSLENPKEQKEEIGEIVNETINKNITENITETNETIQEEINETIEINQTEIENITSKPILIKNIPNIEIQKNTFSTIKISEYFSNAEEFFLLQAENITTTTYDHTIELKPDKEFIGNRTLKIIVSNSFGKEESNLFNITVAELKTPTLLKNIPDFKIQKNSSIEINISEYFSKAEQYYMLQIKNISTTTYGHSIKILPDASFVGERKGKIIAANDFGYIESNYFNIEIYENITEITKTEALSNITIPIDINISTLQYKAVINRPVKWIKVVDAEKAGDIQNLTLDLPKDAENISIKTGEEIQQALSEINKYETIIEEATPTGKITRITGNVAFDIKNTEGIITRFWKWLMNIRKSGITGNVIQEAELEKEIKESPENKIIDIGSVAEKTNASDIAVEYYTQGPVSNEETISRGKRISISAADEENYTEILAFAEIPEKFNVGQESEIKIYWNEENIYVNFTAYDTDNNGKLDYVAWIVPHLSNQTFEIILITKAEHLNSNREFISDIYEEVKSLDNIWSESIRNNEYVRVTFEINLTKKNDITLYPRVISGLPTIEVYEQDKNELIAEFSNLNSNQYNKVYLTNLISGSQNVFDLKILNGEVEFDHIIDPQTTTKLNPAENTQNVTSGTIADDGAFSFNSNDLVASACYAQINVFGGTTCSKTGTASADAFFIWNVTLPNYEVLHEVILTGTAANDDGSDRLNLSLFNFTANAWRGLVQGSGVTADANFTLIFNITGNTTGKLINNFVKNNLILFMMTIRGGSGDTPMRLDYMEANITYEPAIAPVVNLKAPANGSTSTTAIVSFNATFSDNYALSSANLFVWDSSFTLINQTNRTIKGLTDATNITVELPGDGVYYWNYLAIDNSSNQAMNLSNFTLTISQPDTTFPLIDITFPINASNFSYNSAANNITINYTMIEPNIFNCWYTNSSGKSNATITCGTNISRIWLEGINNVTVYANDTSGNINSSSVKFRIDTTYPLISISYPANSSNFSTTNINVNYTLTESNIFNCWYTNSSGLFNTTLTCGNNLTGINWPEGINNVTVYANDSVGNLNSSSIKFRIDTKPPYFLHTVNNFELTNGSSFNYDVNATDDGVGIQNYSINDSRFSVNVTGWVKNASEIDINLYYLNLTVNDSLGNQNSTVFYVNVTAISNTPPQIIKIFNETFAGGITLNDGPSNTNITVNFSVYDAQGTSDLNSSTAMLNISKEGELTRSNSTCSQIQAFGNYANYSCKIDLWWFDSDGSWDITAFIEDNSQEVAQNTTNTLTINTLTGFVGTGALSFSTLNPGATNQTPTTAIRLNNTGNQNIFKGGISVNATSLRGETDDTKYLYSGNFSISNSSGASNPQCDIITSTAAGTAINLTSVSGESFIKVNGTSINATLMRGNYTINNGATGQEDLYACLRQVGFELSPQSYSTTSLGPWTIKIMLAVFTISAAGLKSRNLPKSKKKRKKIAKDDKLVQAMDLILDELKQEYSLNKKEIIEVLVEKLKSKYKVNEKEVMQIIGKREIEIPISIFSKELGGLEAVSKYMKENLNLSYKEISEKLGRNERTIWTSYKKASEKQKTPFDIKDDKKEITFPISAFKNKNLTVLESVIVYLRNKEVKLSKIAKLIDRDQRNVYTIYSRAVKKLKRNI